nr:DNA polymerase III subunit epsilon [Candidatus Schneideria nysicola]
MKFHNSLSLQYMKNNTTRQVVLDTETTGINKLGLPYEGHRIIEIGAVEIVNRGLTGQFFHTYLKPDRPIDPEAFNIHGISDNFLSNKPHFSQIADNFFSFIYGSELIVHNASFDIGFIDQEFFLLKRNIAKVNTFCKVIDSLKLARKIFPGKRNNLDALCDRYLIDNKKRSLHGALIDAKILANVFLHMTGGQTSLNFILNEKEAQSLQKRKKIRRQEKTALKIIYASVDEETMHKRYLDMIQYNNKVCIWKRRQQ